MYQATGVKTETEDLKNNKSKNVLQLQKKLYSHNKEKRLIARRRPSYLNHKNRSKENGHNKYTNMGIFIVFFVIVVLICMILLIKIKCKQNRKKRSRMKVATEALQSMYIRKHDFPLNYRPSLSLSDYNEEYGTNNVTRSCVVCLEYLHIGKDTRILPCFHEFHVACIDPWLISNFTCPLCMYNIIGATKPKPKRRRQTVLQLIARKLCFSTDNNNTSNDPELANEHSEEALLTCSSTNHNTGFDDLPDSSMAGQRNAQTCPYLMEAKPFDFLEKERSEFHEKISCPFNYNQPMRSHSCNYPNNRNKSRVCVNNENHKSREISLETCDSSNKENESCDKNENESYVITQNESKPCVRENNENQSRENMSNKIWSRASDIPGNLCGSRKSAEQLKASKTSNENLIQDNADCLQNKKTNALIPAQNFPHVSIQDTYSQKKNAKMRSYSYSDYMRILSSTNKNKNVPDQSPIMCFVSMINLQNKDTHFL